jgi:hypothetical protein
VLRGEIGATRAGVYKSLDGGQSWVRSERGLVAPDGVEPYVSGFCQSRSEPEIAYLITIMDGISRTADFGESFEPLVLPENSDLLECAVDPADSAVVYALAGFKVIAGRDSALHLRLGAYSGDADLGVSRQDADGDEGDCAVRVRGADSRRLLGCL